MIGWLGTPIGRMLQGGVGIFLLWFGMTQLTLAGLAVMMTGLVVTVVAAAPPPFLAPVPAVRRRSSRLPG
jgi:hypothetical protein